MDFQKHARKIWERSRFYVLILKIEALKDIFYIEHEDIYVIALDKREEMSKKWR